MKPVIKGAIFYARLKDTIGSEQRGFRPVLVLQNNKGNRFSPTTIIAPITTKYYRKRKLPTHVMVKQFDKLRPNSIILLEQITTIDKSRLSGYIGMLNSNQMREVEKVLQISFGFFDEYPDIDNHE